MISDVGVGLVQLLGDLSERIPLKEMQPQRLALLLGQGIQNPPPTIPSEEPFDCGVVFCPNPCLWISIHRPVYNPERVETAGLQLPSPKKGLRVCDLKDPRACATLCAIKKHGFLMNVEEHLLSQIICCSIVSKNSATHTTNRSSKASK